MTNFRSTIFIQPLPITKTVRRFIVGFLFSVFSNGMVQAQTEELPLRMDGDIGLGGYYTGSIIRGKAAQVTALPYGYFDYGRMFMRIDTLGVKTIKLGYGYLEIAGRFSQDGFSSNATNLTGLQNRQASFPFGLGTLQITPMGALFINAFHDINQSGGDLFEAIYAGKLDSSYLTFYPLAGAEYQSSKFVRYYYGISVQEAAAGQYSAYQPVGSFNPLLGLSMDTKLTGEYHLNFYLRRKWLGNAIQSSPIVNQGTMDTSYISLSYRLK